jgi:hypothetical protein
MANDGAELAVAIFAAVLVLGPDDLDYASEDF